MSILRQTRIIKYYIQASQTTYTAECLSMSNQVHPNSFTAKYNVNKLIYVETTPYINNAIAREKEIKGWSRKKKLELIKSVNPDLNNLLEEY